MCELVSVWASEIPAQCDTNVWFSECFSMCELESVLVCVS